jgi:ABC-type microcin C transport system permease subunit YejB
MWLKYKFQLVESKNKQEKFDKKLSEILNDLAIFKILDYTDKTGIVYENYKGYLKTLDISSEASGNLDARKIREIAKKYGFTVPEKCDELIDIKKFRNQLAHGEKTFSEIGREKSVVELIKINTRVIIYLRIILKNIRKFIDRKNYLASNLNVL